MRKRIVLMIAALALLLAACGETEPAAETPPEATARTTVAEVSPPLATAVPSAPATEIPPTEAPATDAPATATPAPPPVTPLPETAAPDVTEPPEATEAPPETEPPAPPGDPEFADTAFLGNSLVEGLGMFGGLEQGEFYALESASVVNVGTLKNTALRDGTPATLLEALCEDGHGKIYVLLGINEISFAPDYFARLYGGVLDAVTEREPEAEIYVMSLTPVTKAKNDEGSYFTMDAVNAYNAALRQLAEERGYRYIDLVDALAGEDGFLPEGDSTDGIHLTREKYPVWADYLRAHI